MSGTSKSFLQQHLVEQLTNHLLDYSTAAMDFLKYFLVIFSLCLTVDLSLGSDGDETSTTETPTTASVSDRAGRKYIPLYEAPDRPVEEGPFNYGPQASPRALPKGNYLPYRHAASGVMKKSGTNVNWSVWKGDDNSGDDASEEADGAKWPVPSGGWNNDPWAVDPTYLMMLKNAMADIKADQKPEGFLAKLKSDPALLLIAASIPISLLLAAVLPAIMNMWMNGSSMPVISTTATGAGNGQAREQQLDILPYLTPLVDAVGTFGVRSITNPDCMQRIFCEVAQDKIPFPESKYVRKAASIARFLSDGSWLENYGVKELVDSLGSGKCEDIPCTNSKPDNVKSRYSSKLEGN
ncbi:hypothetical protein AVEN_275337-1 [Araneus ventricosus]|uniref:Uncharacterized protein n=1 Tax=Araneus ventricosus TaxID=182803 RepID=A0A4Y2KTV2_ARAVE|nr:hypothetical protein AVEN_275337-1 [Araneus ventricosus]